LNAERHVAFLGSVPGPERLERSLGVKCAVEELAGLLHDAPQDLERERQTALFETELLVGWLEKMGHRYIRT
jgi:hypothetical protein